MRAYARVSSGSSVTGSFIACLKELIKTALSSCSRLEKENVASPNFAACQHSESEFSASIPHASFTQSLVLNELELMLWLPLSSIASTSQS